MSFSFRRTTITHKRTYILLRCLCVRYVSFRFSILFFFFFTSLPHFHAHSPPFHLRFFTFFCLSFNILNWHILFLFFSLLLSYSLLSFDCTNIYIHAHIHAYTHIRLYIRSHIAAVILPLCIQFSISGSLGFVFYCVSYKAFAWRFKPNTNIFYHPIFSFQ